jgi:uncharacterized membrane protein HdeD (DUF308 family)
VEATGEQVRRVKWVGIALIVMGAIAILAPLVTAVAIGIWVGACILLAGMFRLTYAFQGEAGRARTHGLLSGGIAVLCGVIMVLDPLLSLGVLSILLIVWLGMDGLTKVMAAMQCRPEAGWGWTLFSGALSILIAVLLLAGWPASGPWVISTFAGIWAIFTGWALVQAAAAVGESRSTA